MTFSMTGFASQSFTLSMSDGTTVNVAMNLKSLNGRFFETTFRVPHALMPLETELIKIFKNKLRRGHLYCTIQLSNPQAFKSAVSVATPILNSYKKAIVTVQDVFGIDEKVTLSNVLHLPNIFSVEEQSLDESSKKQILTAAQELVDAVHEVRAVEGEHLAKDMMQRCVNIKQEIDTIEKRSSHLIEEFKKAMSAELHELKQSDHAPETVAQRNIALQTALDKMGVHEEIVRFNAHVKTLKNIIYSDAPEKGKRVDFTLQELMREVNTIASKSSDAQISTAVISIKVEIEKMREQAQNIV